MPSVRVRLGYVANALRLPESSPSHTTTVAALARLPSEADRFGRLEALARLNLANTLRILRANIADGILLYRVTSRLVPLATHPIAAGWEYWRELAPEFAEIGAFARATDLRLSAHPDHFTLLNSPRAEVLEASLGDLEYHERVFTAMGLPEAPLVLHVGGGYREPAAARERFLKNFVRLPPTTARRIVLENDDRTFNAGEVLAICRELALPMVLDVHHHQILPSDKSLEELLPAVFATWGEGRPAFHFSSPRSATEPRSHADYIEAEPFLAFVRLAAAAGRDFDVMLEAKAKDLALFQLGEELRGKPGVKLLGTGEMEIEY